MKGEEIIGRGVSKKMWQLRAEEMTGTACVSSVKNRLLHVGPHKSLIYFPVKIKFLLDTLHVWAHTSTNNSTKPMAEPFLLCTERSSGGFKNIDLGESSKTQPALFRQWHPINKMCSSKPTRSRKKQNQEFVFLQFWNTVYTWFFYLPVCVCVWLKPSNVQKFQWKNKTQSKIAAGLQLHSLLPEIQLVHNNNIRKTINQVEQVPNSLQSGDRTPAREWLETEKNIKNLLFLFVWGFF